MAPLRTLDGPVVVAARRALDADDVCLVLPYRLTARMRCAPRSGWPARPATLLLARLIFANVLRA